MTRKKEKSGLSILVSLIVGLFKILWWIITSPYQIYKVYSQGKQAEENERRFFKNLRKGNKYSKTESRLYQVNFEENTPYCRKALLTNNELKFYQYLKPIAQKRGLVVLTKIRMADLVEPTSKENSEYMRAFGKIKAKHVDFALANPENLKIELLIELDDRTHVPGNERDAFVEKVYRSTGYKLYRTWNETDLEKNIANALGGSTATAAPDITELIANINKKEQNS